MGDRPLQRFPRHLRAARIHEYGGTDVIRYEEVPLAVPGPGQVLIRVAATSYNPSDAALRAGYLQDVLPVKLPYTLGVDVSDTTRSTSSST